MKHLSATWWKQAAAAAELIATADLKALLVARLATFPGPCGKADMAAELGLSERRLTAMLRSGRTIDDRTAAALGYRRVVRFERIPHEVVLRGDPKTERIS